MCQINMRRHKWTSLHFNFYIIMNKLFALIFFLMPAFISAQSCEEILADARKASNYKDAILKFLAAQKICPTKRDQEIKDYILAEFTKIDALKNKALKAETAANNAKVETKNALDKLKKTANEAVTILVAEIDKDILQLDYNATYDKCKTALALEEQPDAVKKRVLEIAYFYTEADTLDAAVKTLQLLKINVAANRKDLETAIKNANPQFFTFFENRYYPTMMPVEGGTFVFGGKNDEDSISHDVTVKSFSIAKTETTFWQYNLFAKATHNYISPPNWQYAGDNPAVNVSWYDAVAYCNWLSRQRSKKEFYVIDSTNHKQSEWIVTTSEQTKGFRLPTELEWEFAARGGNKTHDFEYSGDSVLNNVAWYGDNSTNSRTHTVATKKENELHLNDMSGNVWEWCFDWYSEKLNISDEKLWVSPEKGSHRVFRGGSWLGTAQRCRVTIRNGNAPAIRNNGLGFRVVLSSPQ